MPQSDRGRASNDQRGDSWCRPHAGTEALTQAHTAISDFLAGSTPWGLHVTDRIALFLVSNPQPAPAAVLHHIKQNQVLHRHDVLAHVQAHRTPWVGPIQRSQNHDLDNGFWQSTPHFGFIDKLDVPAALEVDDCLRAGTVGKRGRRAAASRQVDRRCVDP
ncbi:hypothetical protein XaplCFBP3123_17640 [Xanthomonas arboricola pv. populi]|nr:hypothetical protein XaplCFBP3123_17640 [Xanthomonas arboricola pv. populi]